MREAVDQGIADLDPTQWNSLTDGASPFVRHSWLAALETTGCVGAGSGWQGESVATLPSMPRSLCRQITQAYLWDLQLFA